MKNNRRITFEQVEHERDLMDAYVHSLFEDVVDHIHPKGLRKLVKSCELSILRLDDHGQRWEIMGEIDLPASVSGKVYSQLCLGLCNLFYYNRESPKFQIYFHTFPRLSFFAVVDPALARKWKKNSEKAQEAA